MIEYLDIYKKRRLLTTLSPNLINTKSLTVFPQVHIKTAVLSAEMEVNEK